MLRRCAFIRQNNKSFRNGCLGPISLLVEFTFGVPSIIDDVQRLIALKKTIKWPGPLSLGGFGPRIMTPIVVATCASGKTSFPKNALPRVLGLEKSNRQAAVP